MIVGAVIFQDKRVSRWALAATFIGALLLGCGLFLDVRRVFFSYLAAHAFLVSIAQGALFFLLIGHTMGAVWPVALRRLTETIAGTMPLLAVLFIPLCFGLDRLYPWVSPEQATDPHARHLLEHKLPYLNVPSFLVRAAIYFALWSTLAVLLRRWSIQTDEAPAPEAIAEAESNAAAPWSRMRLSRTLSAAMLPAVGLTVIFSAFDWLMSLTPLWQSALYGIYVGAGGFLAALATLSLSTFLLDRHGWLPGIESSHYHALGRLLFAFTIFWAYIAYFQYFLIWIANKPEEVSFYLDRSRGGFRFVSGLLIFGHAAAFFTLLPFRLKRRARVVAAVAVWLLILHYADVYWLVMPALKPSGIIVHWLDFAALLALGGASIAFGCWLLRDRPTAPIHDPVLPAALEYKSP